MSKNGGVYTFSKNSFLVNNISGLKDVSNMNPDTTLADLGLDSLMGVEVKQTLERDYDLVMPMTEIRKLTFSKLREVNIFFSGFSEGFQDEEMSLLIKYKEEIVNDSIVLRLRTMKPHRQTRQSHAHLEKQARVRMINSRQQQLPDTTSHR